MPRPSLQPGTHGKLAVAPTTDALASRGAFVAHTRVRPADGGDVQLVRRFGATEEAALTALREAVTARIGAVDEISQADRFILGMHQSFLDYIELLDRSDSYVSPGSDADGDRVASGSRVIPTELVKGQVDSVLDHLRAWTDKTSGSGDSLQMSLYADWTLFRPVLESLASAILMLGPDESDERITNALKVAAHELQEMKRFTKSLRDAGAPDPVSESVQEKLEAEIASVCTATDRDVQQALKAKLPPSTLPTLAAPYVSSEGRKDFYRNWAICSAHSHAQLFGVLRYSARSVEDGGEGSWVYAELDSESFAEMLRFVFAAMQTLVELLNKRGHMLRPRVQAITSVRLAPPRH